MVADFSARGGQERVTWQADFGTMTIEI